MSVNFLLEDWIGRTSERAKRPVVERKRRTYGEWQRVKKKRRRGKKRREQKKGNGRGRKRRRGKIPAKRADSVNII